MKKFLVMLCAVCIVLGVSGSASAVFYNGHDYVVVDLDEASWADAGTHMLTTLGQDWYLATITDQDEQTWIQSTLLENVSGEYWLGGYQDPYYSGQNPADDWNWVTGEAWSYTNWFPGHPQ